MTASKPLKGILEPTLFDLGIVEPVAKQKLPPKKPLSLAKVETVSKPSKRNGLKTVSKPAGPKKSEQKQLPAKQIEKAPNAYRTISEVAEDLDVPQHVLRFWETKFLQLKPLKRGGGRRYYRTEDIALLRRIHTLLYGEGYTIKGAQKLLKTTRVKPSEAMVTAPVSPQPSHSGLIFAELLTELKALRTLVGG